MNLEKDMLQRNALMLSLGAVLLATGAARAGDCYNDDQPLRNDLEPAVLQVSDADVAEVLARINAYEQHAQAERQRRAAEQARVAAAAEDTGS